MGFRQSAIYKIGVLVTGTGQHIVPLEHAEKERDRNYGPTVLSCVGGGGIGGFGRIVDRAIEHAQEREPNLTVPTSGLSRILDVVGQDTDRILRQVVSTGWNTDRIHALATNVKVVSLAVDDRLFEQQMEQAFAARGGEDAFIAHAVTSRHLERELRRIGYDGQVPYHSMDDIREAIAIIRDDGVSGFMGDASTAMRLTAEMALYRFSDGGGDGAEDNERCIRNCQRALREADIASKTALAICLGFAGSPACIAATAIALYAWLYAQAMCERCH